MALFGTFRFGEEMFGTGSSGGGGTFVDYTVIVNMAAATEVLPSEKRIEVQTGTKWDDVIAVDWILPAVDNGKVDDRPVPHPDWP